ncbi:WHG domain-containing protein [Streptococcus massiliensis]|uniref:TetR family transcriptional regulator n=1 Tax=Streptococcus massiliensis TaxID=313439 RepID=A0A380KYM1_9STRE|nr:TetR/AcrR family transcriptional regulator [Streptococcus massiliensis]SUN76227.1 TetR family transcriptional regulator [Streptococcus massiliensis]
MPPKNRFTKQEIIDTAFELVRKQGMEALTARALAENLQASSKVIFGLFENMQDLKDEVLQAVKKYYATYIEKALKQEQPFKQVGIQYIVFASTEPQLFRLLFMTAQPEISQLENALPLLDEQYEAILQSIIQSYSVEREQAKRLYLHLWIYTHGIATLYANQMGTFRQEEIEQMLLEIFVSLLKNQEMMK